MIVRDHQKTLTQSVNTCLKFTSDLKEFSVNCKTSSLSLTETSGQHKLKGVEIRGLWVPTLIIFALFLGAFIIRLIFSKYLDRVTTRTKVPWDKLFQPLKNVIFIWAILLSIYLLLPYITIPIHIQHVINKALLIIFVLSLAWSSSSLFIKIIDYYLEKKTGLLTRITLIEIFVKIVIYILAFVIILHILDINITPFITTFGIAGLAIGLALKDTLENFFSGIYILMARQIKPGDFIRLESGEEGFVENINWRTTTIRTQQNNLIIIPNAKLAQSRILNYHLPIEELSVLVPVGVSYSSDLERVERITLEVAKEIMKTHPAGVPDFEPAIRYNSFGDFSINFNVILRCKQAGDRFLLIHDFIKKLHKRYKEEGIEIPFPIRTVYLYNMDKDKKE